MVPGWPDDVTLEPDESPPPGTTVPSRSPESVVEDLAYRPPWSADASVRRPIRPPALVPPTPFGADGLSSERLGRGGLSGDGLRSAGLGNAGLGREGLSEDDGDYGPHADDDSADDRLLGGAGAFGAGPRARLGAFDPGRRGVRALAAVAVVVVLIAALLAWQARPRVDPVAPPGIDPAAAAASLTNDDPAVPGHAAGPGGSGPAASSPVEVVVAVGGKVRKPGLVQLPPGARVADALQAAGGADPGVDVAPLNLARKVTDGELIMVGVTLPPGAVTTAPAAHPAPGAPGAGPVNLNTATLAELDTLPGVGPVLAQRIVDARDAQGGFKAVSDLREVEGIGTSRYEQLKDLVTV